MLAEEPIEPGLSLAQALNLSDHREQVFRDHRIVCTQEPPELSRRDYTVLGRLLGRRGECLCERIFEGCSDLDLKFHEGYYAPQRAIPNLWGVVSEYFF